MCEEEEQTLMIVETSTKEVCAFISMGIHADSIFTFVPTCYLMRNTRG